MLIIPNILTLFFDHIFEIDGLGATFNFIYDFVVQTETTNKQIVLLLVCSSNMSRNLSTLNYRLNFIYKCHC